MKFQVGDKVEFVMNYGSFRKGDVVKVTGIWPNEKGVEFEGKGKTGNCYNERIRMVKPSKNQRITALESVVKDLEQKIIDIRNDYRYDLKQAETRIKMLEFKLEEQTKLIPPSIQSVEEIIEFEGNRYRKVDREARERDLVVFKRENDYYKSGKPYQVLSNVQFVDEDGDEQDVYNVFNRKPQYVDVYELIKQELTPNQQRAEIIEKAKKFVEVKKECVRDSTFVSGGISRKKKENPNFYNYAAVEVEFIINQEKHTVVSLVKFNDGSIMTKGIAKCNPSDVFNVHIGKAISLGRALGLDVSEFEQAIQPNEIVKGHIIQWKIFNKEVYEVLDVDNKHYDFKRYNGWEGLGFYYENLEKLAIIINDTNAQYEEVK